jgi:putative flippase GtrA
VSRRTFLGYLVSGGSAALVDLGLFLLLALQGLPVPVASMASFGIAAVWNYTISSRFVFRQPLVGRRFGQFLAVAIAGALINSGMTWLATSAGIAMWLAKLVGIGFAFLFNYAANSLYVFR